MKPLFIHIPKTGGMTVRHGFRGEVLESGSRLHRDAEYTAAVAAQMKRHGEHHGFEHARWRDLREDVRERRCFALVRNPWDRVASRYYFGLQVIRTGRVSPGYIPERFEEFLEERHRWGATPYFWHRAVRGWYPALDYVTDESGVIRCDILRTEHLDDDVKAYLGRKPPRPRNVTSRRSDYHDLYDDRTRQIVADWYAVDIEAFGFDFDTAATRNIWESPHG